MKFSVDRDELLGLLQVVVNVVERRHTLPILSNLLLAVRPESLTITGSDQEVELIAEGHRLDCEESGEVTVPARKMLDICRSLPAESLLVFVEEDDRVLVESGRFKSHLATLPVQEFPKVAISSSDVSIELSAAALLSLLKKTSFAMAQQDVRYFFNGVLIELTKNKIRFVATNGQRLAVSELDASNPTNQQYIVPRKGINELVRLIPEDPEQIAQLNFSANHLTVICGNTILTTKLIDATYPDYQRAIPEEGDKVLKGDCAEIREALNRTAILSNEMYRNVRLLLDHGKLELHANNPLHEEAEELVSVDYDDAPLEIGFNVNYLIEALSAIGEGKVTMKFIDANNACLLTTPDDINTRYVISPMML